MNNYQVQAKNNAVFIAFSEFQHFAGLLETGEVDEKTEEAIRIPRCGLPDMNSPSYLGDNNIKSRKKRFALHGSRWKTKTLTYRISKYPSRLSSRTTDRLVRDC